MVASSGSGSGSDHAAVAPADRLSNFYLKYNRALLDCIAIDKEKSRIAAENSQLEDLISQYISGTQLSDQVLAFDNPLFVVNGRSQRISIVL